MNEYLMSKATQIHHFCGSPKEKLLFGFSFLFESWAEKSCPPSCMISTTSIWLIGYFGNCAISGPREIAWLRSFLGLVKVDPEVTLLRHLGTILNQSHGNTFQLTFTVPRDTSPTAVPERMTPLIFRARAAKRSSSSLTPTRKFGMIDFPWAAIWRDKI